MDEYNYYQGYLLDDNQYVWDLTENDKQLLDAAVYLVDNRYSIRKAALNCNYSKSTLHRKIHTQLRQLSSELYKCVIRTLSKSRR